MAKYASGAMLLLNLIQVTESISGSVVPLALFCSFILICKFVMLEYDILTIGHIYLTMCIFLHFDDDDEGLFESFKREFGRSLVLHWS